MSTNLFARLQRILPPSPVLIGKVLDINEAEGYSTVELLTRQGSTEYAPGIATGSRIRARGTFVPVDKRAYVRDGVIETQAPDGEIIDIVVGSVVVPSAPLVFDGPISDQEGGEGEDFSLALAGFWTGGSRPLNYTVVDGTLPAGLALHPGTGVVSGEFSEPGTFTVKFAAADMLGFAEDSNTVTFVVEEAAAPAFSRIVGKLEFGQFQYSDDGMSSWTNAGQSSTYQATFAYNGTTMVAAKFESSANNILTSTDGTSWTPRTTMDSEAKTSVAYGAGRFVVARYESDIVESSADGVTWASTTLPDDFFASNGPFVHFVDRFFVACGGPVWAEETTASHSTNGTSWTTVAVPSLEPEVQDSEDPFFVAVGAMIKVGSTWTLLPAGPSFEYLTTTNFSSFSTGTHGAAIAANPSVEPVFDGTYWFFAGSKGVWRTADGTTFTQVLSGSWSQVLLAGATLIAHGSSGVRHSIDAGASWTTISGTAPGRGALGVLPV